MIEPPPRRFMCGTANDAPAATDRSSVDRLFDLRRLRHVAFCEAHHAGKPQLQSAAGFLLNVGGEHARALLHE